MTRVLLVENGGFSRRVIGAIFNRINVQVDYVASEDEAVRSSHLNYDLILISANMDYAQIVNHIRLNETTRNFIVLTTFLHERESRYVRGIDVICNKPLNETEAKLLLEARDKYGKVFYSKTNLTTFKQMRPTHSTNDSVRQVSQSPSLSMR